MATEQLIKLWSGIIAEVIEFMDFLVKPRLHSSTLWPQRLLKITNSKAIGLEHWGETDLCLSPKTRPKAKISDEAQTARPVTISPYSRKNTVQLIIKK